jgi:hypothetical protein
MENNFGEELSTKITPIIILSYNRPELLKKLVEVIDNSSHLPIIVSQDGPKFDSDVEKIRKCIQITEKLVLKREIEIFKNNENQGIQKSVTNIVTYAVQKYGRAIILEDDCIPSNSLIPFLENALSYFENDLSIGHISGYNAIPQNKFRSQVKEIRKSIYPFSWGWATWQRAWENYDSSLEFWSTIEGEIKLDEMGFNRLEKFIWRSNFKLATEGVIDSWATRWVSSLWRNNLYSISSNYNLIRYEGKFNGTHSFLPQFYRELKVKEHTFTFDEYPEIDMFREKWVSKKQHRCTITGSAVRVVGDYIKRKTQ